jgi:hypothetical protein
MAREIMSSNRCLRLLVCGLWLAACSADSGTLPSPRLFDPLSYRSLPGPEHAFGVRDGSLRSYFHREGPLAASVLVQCGSARRALRFAI